MANHQDLLSLASPLNVLHNFFRVTVGTQASYSEHYVTNVVFIFSYRGTPIFVKHVKVVFTILLRIEDLNPLIFFVFVVALFSYNVYKSKY